MATDTTRWRLFANQTGPEPAAPALDVLSQQAMLEQAFKPEKRRNYDYLLIFRFLLTNLIGVTIVAAAYVHGIIDSLKINDPTRLSSLTVGLFLAGLFLCGVRIARISRELNEVRAKEPKPDSKVAQYLALVETAGREGRTIAAESLRLKLISRIVAIRHIANTLVILGLLGTVVGFIVMIGQLDLQGTDTAQIQALLAQMTKGMGIALVTTLVGLCANLLLGIQLLLLDRLADRVAGAILDAEAIHP